MKSFFDYPDIKIESAWRSIILLGNNTSCYKFALGKTILEMNTSTSEVDLRDIALPYAKNICEHLQIKDKQTTNPSSNFLDTCRKYNLKQVSEEKLIDVTLKEGFRYVIDAFHNVNKNETTQFFENNRKKNNSIIFTDNFYSLLDEDKFQNLPKELDSRWNLWENSIFLGTNSSLLQLDINEHEELTLMNVPVTSARNAIIGYQEGRCFYCRKRLSLNRSHKDACEVDHFFPKYLFERFRKEIFKKLNLVWNLVCACNECNGSSQKSNKLPDLKFLKKLKIRNDLYAETPHPLSQYIMEQTGKTRTKREEFLRNMLKEAAIETGTKEGDYWSPKTIYGE
tara:strand:- start:561 stop:1577 length:1017 start_codon:yes stop_codon:yes gene_type:complete